MDLVIAATANVAGVPVLTRDERDFAIIADLVDVQAP
jgi:predicted nucleic acid-binding protein